MIVGFVLVGSELIIPAMVLVWFGLAALLLALFVAVLPGFSASTQIFSWTILSLALVLLWMRVFKPGVLKTRAGTAGSMIGETGLLASDVAPYKNGTVRFQGPVMGSDVWDCLADESIKAGTRVVVTAVEGKSVRVAART